MHKDRHSHTAEYSQKRRTTAYYERNHRVTETAERGSPRYGIDRREQNLTGKEYRMVTINCEHSDRSAEDIPYIYI